MRLWHIDLIPQLPRQQLLGQHRECCALRGNGWGKKHSTVDYVFKHSPKTLYNYHKLIMLEMSDRGYIAGKEWWEESYRGKTLGYSSYPLECFNKISYFRYPEHNPEYLCECLHNLENKGIILFDRTESTSGGIK